MEQGERIKLMPGAVQFEKVMKRKPGADYWRRVYRIAGSLPVTARLKIALRILKGGDVEMKKKPKPKPC